MSSLPKTSIQAERLSLDELRRLDALIHRAIAVKESEERRPRESRKREVVSTKQYGGVTYQQELVRCGKEKCHCATGEGHGPYYYAYWSEGGKTRSKYVGKKLTRERQRETQRERRGEE